MGDGQRLKQILKEKNTNVRQVSVQTGISATTLYSAIQNDSSIRFDNALRLANVLGVDPMDICAAAPFSEELSAEDLYPTVKDPKGKLDKMRVKGYTQYSLLPLMELYGKTGISDVDKMLTYFYMLNDESRKEVVDFLMFKLNSGKDPEREEQIKQFKKWK